MKVPDFPSKELRGRSYWIGFALGVGLTAVAVLMMLWRWLGE
jgi:heme/copper-type cytochrome/quinol oxidase subunit 4